MPRYLFIVQNDKPAPDSTEIDLDGPEAARAMAMAEASEMLRDHQGQSWPAPPWWVHVTDERGATVCRLTVSGTAGSAIGAG